MDIKCVVPIEIHNFLDLLFFYQFGSFDRKCEANTQCFVLTAKNNIRWVGFLRKLYST